MLTYRPHQEAAQEASVEAYHRGVYKQLICMATGTGKSPLIARMKQWYNIRNRQMILVHRDELAKQIIKTVEKWNPTEKVGLEMGDSYASDSDGIVVASVPTIGRAGSKRLQRFSRDEFDLVSPDEAHHSTAASYKAVFSHFGFDANDCHRVLAGVTATPNRADGQGLGQVFDEIVYQYTILDGIKEGFLVNLRGIKLSTRTNLDSIPIYDGDFAKSDLSKAVNTPQRNKLIVSHWKANARQGKGFRQTVAFCVDVKHAQDLAETFNKAGIKAAAIWSGDKFRAEKLAAHRAGELTVLCNYGILTEGYDDWRISCIIMARPTKSDLLFIQMVGRGTRIPDYINNLLEAQALGIFIDKYDCIVLDVVDSTSRHSLVTLASLFGLAPKADLQGKTITEALEIVDSIKQKRPEIILDELQRLDQLTTEDVDLFKDRTPIEIEQNTKLRWSKISEDVYRIMLPMGEQVTVYKDLLEHWDVKGNVCGKGFTQQGLHSLPEAFRVADNFVTMFGKGLLNILRREPLPQKSKPLSLSPLASEPQRRYIASLYKDNSVVMSKLGSLTAKEASRLIATFNVRK